MRITKFIKSPQEYYGCDGINENCIQKIPYDEVTWFTSRLGFCSRCAAKLHEAPNKILNFLYDLCDGDDEDVVDFVVRLTK